MSKRVLLTVATMALAAAATTATAGPSGAGDANDDGRDELVVGIYGQAVGGDDDAGRIVVFPNGSTTGAQAVDSDTAGVVGAAEPGDGFGRAMAWGDFNGDGHDDLAVGAPFEDVGTFAAAGAVTILEGTAGGVTAAGSRELTENTTGMAGTSEPVDLWGLTLATGDVNGDGYADLVVNAPTEDLGDTADVGAITLIPGSSSGLDVSGSVQKTQASVGVPSDYGPNELWGDGSVAVGDVNGDGFDDIAVGSAFEEVDGINNAGALMLLRGSAGGIATAGSQLITESTAGVAGAAEASDFFSYISVGFGDFDDDGYADLAVGSPYEDVGALDEAGALTIIHGSSTGLTGSGSRQLTSNTAGVVGVAEASDYLGWSSPGIGDFNGDGYDDVATAIPYQTVGGDTGAGAVLVLNGSASGIVTAGSKEITADTTGVAGTAEEQDQAGLGGLRGLHLRNGAYDDLVVSVGLETVGSASEAGAVIILRGSASGLTGTNSIQLYEDLVSVPGTSEPGDRFGLSIG